MGVVKGIKTSETLLVPAVPSCIGREQGAGIPLCDLDEKALEAIGKQYTTDLLAKRAAMIEKRKASAPADGK